jgi:hypothetical protein
MQMSISARTAASLKLAVLVALGLTAAVSGSLMIYRWRVKRDKAKRIRALKMRKSAVNIGAIFGMDVGGTLTKIIYFQGATSP